MYKRKSRLRVKVQYKLLEHFIAGTTANAVSEILGIQPNTAIRFYMRLRVLIANQLPNYELDGEIEADESYFGGFRKGRRGRGAAGKVVVFGLLKRGGRVYTAIIADVKTNTLLPILREKVKPDSVVFIDTLRSYNALDVSEFKHYRINHSKIFRDKQNHINGIEKFWSQAKKHMRKYNGIKKDNFFGFLKSANGDSMEVIIKCWKNS